MIFMNRENSKTNESHRLALSLSQMLDIKISDKYVEYALQSLSKNYTGKNVRQRIKTINSKQ